MDWVVAVMTSRLADYSKAFTGLAVVTLLFGSVSFAAIDRAPIPDEVIQKLMPQKLSKPDHPLPSKLQRNLEGALRVLERLDRNNDPNTDARLSRELNKRVSEFAVLRPQIRAFFSWARENKFRSAQADQLLALEQLLPAVEKRFDEILKLIDDVSKSGGTARKGLLAKGRAELQAIMKAVGDESEVAPEPSYKWIAPRPQKPQPANAPAPAHMSHLEDGAVRYAFLGTLLMMGAAAPPIPPEAASCSYTSADLAETTEIKLPVDGEIRKLAESLSYSPTKMFKYVSDEIKFEPYWGSLKGALGTLYAKGGNATDQASLLIALLRASNIPARYVRGRIEFKNDSRVLRWLGAKSYGGLDGILFQGQIPRTVDVNAEKVDISHVWVEACLPYQNYRGTAADLTGHRWIPLDPSFKDKSYQDGISINVDFDYTSFMSTRTPDLPAERYGQQVNDEIKRLPPNFENNTIDDVGYIGTILPRQIDILPVSLPYSVIGFETWDSSIPQWNTSEAADLPAKHRYKLSITFTSAANGSVLGPTVLSLPQIALQRVTLSFKGKDSSAQNSITTWLNDPDPDAALPCGVLIVPVIKAEGIDAAVGPSASAFDICTNTNSLSLVLTQPEFAYPGRPAGEVNTTSFAGKIQASDYHALFAYAFQASDRLLTERAVKLLTSVRANSNPNANQEEIEGEFLHLVGLKYMRHITDSRKAIGQLNGESGESGNHIGLTSSRMKVEYLLDIPFSVSRKGFLVDFPGVVGRSLNLVTGEGDFKTFILAGYDSSALESYVWQENARLDAVSTVRGIQFANETGIEVITLNSANWSSESPKLTSNTIQDLNYSSTELSELNAFINQGYTLTLPRSHIQYNNWRGSVYVTQVSNEAGFAAGFVIGGGYSGGYTVDVPVPVTFDTDTPEITGGSGFVYVSPPILDPLNTTFEVDINSAQNTGSNIFTVTAGDPVNMVNGNVYHTERDIVIKGRGGLPFVFERSYNSRAAQDGPVGFGWTHSFNHMLLFKDDNVNKVVDNGDADGLTSSVNWVDGTGNKKFIQVTGSGSGVAIGATFTTPQGFFFHTTRNPDGTYAIRETNGLTYTFESTAGTVGQAAKLVSIRDRNNNMLAFSYTGSLLTSVTDGLDRTLTFTYSGNHVSQICDWTSRCHQYAYDVNTGDLITYKNPLAVAGQQNPVSYTYYSDPDPNSPINHAIKGYTLPRGNGMTFEYYVNGKASRHYNTLGESTTFTYNEFRREAVSLNERGFERQYFFDKNGNPTKIIEERGGERTYTYDTANPFNRISKRDPMGYLTQYDYDANGNVTKTTLPSGATVEYFNFNAFNQPGKVKDARGNYTLFKYDANGNMLQVIKLKSGIGASIDPATYTPVPAELVAWTINTYDSFGNLLSSKQVRDFAGQAGPSVEFVYDSNNLNATTVTRRGDKDGNGTIDTPDSVTLTYDTLGRATTGVRPDFYLTQTVYDAVDRVTQATDDSGNLRTFGFDANGNPSSSILSVGTFSDQMSYGSDLSDRRISTTDSGGFATSQSYDPAGNIVSITDPDGFTLGFQYDPNNKVVAASDQEGRRVSKAVDLDGKPRSVTDPNSNTIRYEYYGSEREGRLKRQIDAAGRSTTYDYDANGNITVVTDNLGRTTLTTYDEFNRATRIAGPVYNDSVFGNIRPVRRNVYDTLGRLVQVSAGRTDSTGTNPASDVLVTQMTYLYDDFGRKLRETDALGRSTNYQFDINGNPIVMTDPKGQITLMTYKYGHQLLSRSSDSTGRGFPVVALASASKSSYSETTAPPPSGFSFLYRGGVCVVDGSGQCIGGDSMLETGVGSAIGYISNNSGTGLVPVYRSTCYSDGSGTCTGWGLSLDVNGTPVAYLSSTAPDTPSGAVPFTQSNGLLLQSLGGTASAYLWSLSTTITLTFGDHFYSIDYSEPADYSAEGVIGFLRQSSGTGTVALKRYVNITTGHHYYSTIADQPSGFTEEATLGYLDSSSSTGLTALYRHFNSSAGDYLISTSATPPSGYVLQATLGYLGVSTNFVTYIRNPIGQVVSASTADVTYTYAYDAAHRVTSVTDSRGNKQLTYAYSAGGRRLNIQDSDGNRTDYQYDPVGRLSGIWAPNNQLTSFVYDDGGRLIEKWFPNGVNTQYTYNPDNTLAQLINRHGTDLIISQHEYTYDRIGNRKSHNELIAGALNPYTYAYDALNRLTTVTNTGTGAVESYAYDPSGNRRTRTSGGTTLAYVHDNANQLLEIHSGSTGGPLTAGLVYDLNGNLQKKCEGGTVTVNSTNCTGSTVTSLTHDNFDRLVQVAKTGISTEIYKYDDQDRRIQKIVGASVTNFLYAGANIAGQYDNTWSSPTATYTHGPGVDAPIMRVAGGTAQYYHQDGLGSVVGVTNQAGTTDGTARYDAYGNRIASTGTISQYGYTGREPDDTGFIYYRARFYDPGIGRFIRRDPIGMSGGMNLYAYGNANPINFNDPMGLTANPASTNLLAQEQSYFNNDVTSGLSAATQGLSVVNSFGDMDASSSDLVVPDLNKIANSFSQERVLGQQFTPRWDTCIDCSLKLQGGQFQQIAGGGAIVSGSAELGIVGLGAGGTGSLGGGLFGGGSQGTNAGGFASFGGFLGGPGYGPSYPSGNSANLAAGAFAGAGIGAFITNGNSATSLEGAFETYSFNLGVGPYKFSIQYGRSGKTWILSGTVGPGIGLSGSGYLTNTWTTK